MKKCLQEKRSEGSRVGQEEKREVKICSQMKTSISLAPQKALEQEFHHLVGFPLRQGCQPFGSLCLSLASLLSGCEGVSHLWGWPLLVSRECSEAGVALPTAPGGWAHQPGNGEIDKALMVITPDNFCNHS